MKNPYLLVLGSNPDLSRAEVATVAEEVLFDPREGLLLAEDLVWSNPRELPRAPEQLFLDQLGGVIRMGEVLGEFGSKIEMVEKIREFFQTLGRDGTQYFGVSSFGTGKDFLADFLRLVEKDLAKSMGQKVRIENPKRGNMDSGRIFQAKLLKKGAEFLVWQREDSFLLARTVANQNLRNYALRDYEKPFRDPHMGMLPPKLAQILINLAVDKKSADSLVTIVDPFCGSGTVNSEAAILGHATVGADMNPAFLIGAEDNFAFLSEKFRYDKKSADFLESEAQRFDWKRIKQGVVATEGWLGDNFHHAPTLAQIEYNQKAVEKLWVDFFQNLAKQSGQGVTRLAVCFPAWQRGNGALSISEKIFAKIKNFGYAPTALFDGRKTYIYKRPNAFVAREICVIERIKK